MARIVPITDVPSLDRYEAYAQLASAVRELRRSAERLAPGLQGRTVWMVNSTEQGGGVAEMMPTLVSLMREVGVATEWVVIETEQAEFYELTKRIHNLIHGAGDPAFGPAHRALYERVNADNAAQLATWMKAGDVLVVHDPQPMPLANQLRASMDLHAVWRCHIGVDVELPQTRAVWEFLRPYADGYGHGVFTAPEYIPDYLRTRASLIHPAIDPLSDKNRDLYVHKLVGVLANAGLTTIGPVLTERYEHTALRLMRDGAFAPAEAADEIGLVHRPVVTQISRWDRLKGFAPLLRAFALAKQRLHDGRYDAMRPPELRRMKLMRLVLAGPDPDSVTDDPEGLAVLDEIRTTYRSLPHHVQDDVAVLALPMANRRENALMVNALQRSSSLVVQNSLREGFGLTVTEAMWKQMPVLASRKAVGPRQQIRDGLDGRLIDDPEDLEALAETIVDVMNAPAEREAWGLSAQRRAHDDFLVFSQVRSWLEVLVDLVGRGAPH